MKDGKCYEYCGDVKIAKTYNQCSLSTNPYCIDGYQFGQCGCEKIIQMQQIINDLNDKINNQQQEIGLLKVIRNTNDQLQNNQIEIDFNQNQNGEDQALQGENDSQKTLKQLENDQILQQQYSHQNYQRNPFLQEQVNQLKDINQL
ncbi:transmembrane protein, putative (macronuclear) [Tetrahymena thermophila SB210]|uniref:Transmembrane protein, putative n=1 Tax=Tetrahymena thermophila (strain SB210) TaxID=312017 RepID=W7X314_TETTS|nr:transmembrane protein, putative [Tetrahymena thermophila SB210]EWS73710.1 transmembrane protein, putative [Tetrahymena thermophila SB210]|eukprot:XP_012653748.1 transmembrane protein, putative [Tetrahymena thermophila SB210]